MVNFILENRNKKSFISSIHKSKGKEFNKVVVCNSFSPDILEYNKISLEPEQLKLVSFNPEDEEDVESKNIHYVGSTRSKKELYFLMIIAKKKKD